MTFPNSYKQAEPRDFKHVSVEQNLKCKADLEDLQPGLDIDEGRTKNEPLKEMVCIL